MKEQIKDIIIEYQQFDFPSAKPREIDIPTDLNIITTLIGARRSGKTYILYNLINNLVTSGILKEQIVFLNLEDERLNLNSNNLDLILQAYSELYPYNNLKDVYFFFDEIQNIKGWQKFIRRIFDTKSRHIFITGSNSKLLSTEIATELRGRTISYRIYPLSFSEYLSFNNVKKELHPQQSRSKLIHYAEKFLFTGGFPETVFLKDKIRIRILQEYFNTMIFRDIVERYNVSNTEVLKFFIKKVFAGVTKPFSINKTYNELRSMGYKISNKYLYDFFDYCNTVFISQSISRFDFSEIKQAKSDKKAYIIDTGLLSSIEFSVSHNKGKLLENMALMEFIKAGKEVFYFKDKSECDFIVNTNGDFNPVQVSYDISNSETRERELRGLAAACKFLKKKRGTIITFDQKEHITYKTIQVDVIPAYEYFLREI